MAKRSKSSSSRANTFIVIHKELFGDYIFRTIRKWTQSLLNVKYLIKNVVKDELK